MIQLYYSVISEVLKRVNQYLEKNSKGWFLLRKINDYEKRCQHGEFSIFMLMEYENNWRRLTRRYKEIYIYGIEFVSIGETIPRLFMYLQDKDERNKDILHIVLPVFREYYTATNIVNKRIFDIFHKHIHFIKEDMLGFWKYVSEGHSGRSG